MSLNLNSQSFINAFKDKMLEAGIPADKHYLFNQSSQLEAFRVIVSKSGVTEALTQIDDILLFTISLLFSSGILKSSFSSKLSSYKKLF